MLFQITRLPGTIIEALKMPIFKTKLNLYDSPSFEDRGSNNASKESVWEGGDVNWLAPEIEKEQS